MKPACLAILFAAIASAAGPDPALVLQRTAIKVRVRMASMPNYTCVQTVTRDYFRPRDPARSCLAVEAERQRPALDPVLVRTFTDRLRLDVSMTDRGEIYSWAGASKFEDTGIESIVHEGPISSGSFGALLSIVFALDPQNFEYRGAAQVDGRSLMEYDFHVAQEKSRYKVRTTDSWVYTAYSGTVQIDPAALEAVRLSLQTARLPDSTGSCQTGSGMEFTNVRIGDREFPLPKQGRQIFVDREGNEVENTTTFAACREYRGDSTITFFAEPAAGEAHSPGTGATAVARVPAGLPLAFELTASIDPETAAAGDIFRGRLASALRIKGGRSIAPAHAVVEGRLLRVELKRTAPVFANIVLRLRTVEVGGVQVPLAAVRDFRTTEGRAKSGTQILLPNRWEEDSGIFRVTGQHPIMKAGSRSDWVTR